MMQETRSDVQDTPKDRRKRKSIAPTPNKANTQLKRRRTDIRPDFENVLDQVQEVEQHKGKPYLLYDLNGILNVG